MRVIEQKMLRAIRAGKSMTSGNTSVEVGALGNWRVLLHGNLIATGGGKRMSFTLAGWNTPTTRSRIHALLNEFHPGTAVYQHDFLPYFHAHGLFGTKHDRQIGSREWIDVGAEVFAAKSIAAGEYSSYEAMQGDIAEGSS